MEAWNNNNTLNNGGFQQLTALSGWAHTMIPVCAILSITYGLYTFELTVITTALQGKMAQDLAKEDVINLEMPDFEASGSEDDKVYGIQLGGLEIGSADDTDGYPNDETKIIASLD